LVTEYRQTIATPYLAASLGYIDEIIEPRHTRKKLIRALELLREKEDMRPKRKHANIPL